ncbi:Protein DETOXIFICATION 19 [Hondaea fermentalgiana]|uniref:Protein DETOXIFICATION 19 n=1 Tax=Hondaea fermentalgiana TaxID=2315210 RepID=A0A2R5G9W9_9STRA|nr:Protein DETOXIFICATION 19 [Hondaea fermentalgiana]|eukprot:GBG24871.1 Protein DETOXIFICATION 19 [Hondaea fermentalgiana]
MERGEVTRFLRVFVVAESFDAEGKAVSNEGQVFGKNDRGQIFELTQSVSGSISISCCGSGCERLSFIRKSSGTSTRDDMVINLGNLRSHLIKKGHLQNFTSALKHVPETYTIRNFGLGRTITGFDFTRFGHFAFLTCHLHNISFVQDGDPETWAAYAEEIRQVVTLYKRSAAHRDCASLMVLPYVIMAAPVRIPSVSLIVTNVQLASCHDINSPAFNVEKILCDVHDALRCHAEQQFMHLSNGARQLSVTSSSDDAYEYDYRRVEPSTVTSEDLAGDNETPYETLPTGGAQEDRLMGDLKLDWRSREQRAELRAWWSITWPTMTLFFASTSFTLVDMSFLGHLGTPEESSKYLAASSEAGVLFDVTIAIFLRGFLQVLTVLCSQAFGAGQYSLLGRWLQLCLVLCTVLGIPVALLWWFASDILGAIFALDVEVKDLIAQFSRYSILRLYPQLFAGAIRQFCLSQGIILPLVVIAFVSIALNIVLNQVLIHGAWGWAGLGFVGSPIATASTNFFICGVSFFYVFYWRTDTARCWPGWSRDVFYAPRVREFLRQGLPLTLATLLEDIQMQTVSSFAIIYASRQTDGAWIIGTHNGLLSFFLSILAFQWGVMKATSVRCAMYIGMQDAMHAKLVAKIAFVVCIIVSLISCCLLLLFRFKIGEIISKDERVINEAATIVLPMSFGFVALSLFYLSMALLDAQGRPNVVALAFFCGAWVVAVPLAYVLALVLDMGILGLWLGLMAGYAVTTLVLCVNVLTTDWNKVLDDALRRNAMATSDMQQYPFAAEGRDNRQRLGSIISADTMPFPSPVLT